MISRKLFISVFLLGCLCLAKLANAAEEPKPVPGGKNLAAFSVDREKKYEDMAGMLEAKFKGEKHRYTWADFLALLDELVDKERYRVCCAEDFIKTTDPAKVVIFMRHDIDRDPLNALRMAKEEHARGIKSSYYVLPTAPYYGRQKKDGVERYACMDQLYLQLQALGHEIGVHNNLLAMMLLWDIDPQAFQKQELEYYRQAGIRIVGTASHGDAVVLSRKLNNTWLFSEFKHPGVYEHEGKTYEYGKLSFKDFGFAYEGYKAGFNKGTGDLSGLKGSAGLIAKLRECKPGDRVSLLTHPCHWGD